MIITSSSSSLLPLHAGLRYFRVEERNGCAVVEIPRDDLLSDLYRGELGGLVIRASMPRRSRSPDHRRPARAPTTKQP
jgi:hypothetical protein